MSLRQERQDQFDPAFLHISRN